MVAARPARRCGAADAVRQGCAVGERLDQPATQAEPDDRDEQDDEVEVPAAASTARQLAHDNTDDDQRQGEPVGPSEQGDRGRNDDE